MNLHTVLHNLEPNLKSTLKTVETLPHTNWEEIARVLAVRQVLALELIAERLAEIIDETEKLKDATEEVGTIIKGK